MISTLDFDKFYTKPRKGKTMNIIGKTMSFAVSLAVASAAFGAELSKSVPKGWDEDFEAGKATAEKSGKLILLAFSGSDWCGWCVKMEKEIYSDKKFIAEAKKKFVLLMIDSPRDKSILSPLAAKQNGELTSKYNVRGFPTTVIVRPSGEEVRRFGGYQRSGVDGFLKSLDEVADAAGVKGVVEISDEEAKKDDRFFFAPAEKGKIASRESKKRKANAKSDFELDEFAGIKFGRTRAEGAPKLEKPYRLLSAVSKTSYAGNKLTSFTLAADASAIKAMAEEDFKIETCKLVRALEGELGVEFAVTSSKIDFAGKKTSVIVHSSKASGVLSVQLSRK